MKVDFWTPITFENGPKSKKEKWIEKVDSYFSLQGRKVVVLDFGNRDLITYKTEKVSFRETALKVISYATVIFPLIALTTKYVLRP